MRRKRKNSREANSQITGKPEPNEENNCDTIGKRSSSDLTANGKNSNEKRRSFKDFFPSEQTFQDVCGFPLGDLTSFERFTKLLYRPTDSCSLGVIRFLFGLCMVLDVVEERGFSDIDLKWGDRNTCHFPLIHGMQVPTLPWMIIIYTIMWMGAFGIMAGFLYKISCLCFIVPYWYLFLLDKSYWNNHTYLYGIVALLFLGTGANKYFSLDAKLAQTKNTTVPLWNYFILKFQFFTLYFIAGLKKSSREWLEGYAMTNLSKHWVFDPFKIFLTTDQTDFLIVHWFGFIFDLTVGFWLLFDKTRVPAMFFCTAFHLMNSRLFSIGMFPYVCLATMPLFCHVDWPRKLQKLFTSHLSLICNFNKNSNESCQNNTDDFEGKEDNDVIINNNKGIQDVNEETRNEKISDKQEDENGRCNSKNEEEEEKEKLISKANFRNFNDKSRNEKTTKGQKFVVTLLLIHMALQFFLPYSHFITKGYNNWVPGLYGYSWDMMVHTWDVILIVIRVRDNENGKDHFIDPQAWAPNDRWSKHGDMVKQYAHCIKENLLRQTQKQLSSPRLKGNEDLAKLSSNLSIYVDVWSSLNGRFQQRIFNPNVDILQAAWHPLEPVSFLMPLLNHYSSYRSKLEEIQRHVYTWSNYTDVLFVADFPGMYLENYISTDFTNVSLTVLEGQITYKEEDSETIVSIDKGNSINVETGKFHKIYTTSAYPSSYMYTYTNETKQELDAKGITDPPTPARSALPLYKELRYKIQAWIRTLGHIANAFFYLVYDVPMLRRIQLN